MLDIRFIRENEALVKKTIKDKGISLDLDELLEVDERRRKLIKETEQLQAKQNQLDKDSIEEARKIKQEIKKLKPELQETEKKFQELMLITPNIYSADSPVGEDDSKNEELYRKGDTPSFSWDVKDHITLGKNLDIIDTENGTKVSGFRGYYLKNEGALLSFAVLWYCIEKMIAEGFSFMIPPTILREFALTGSGHFPFGKEEIYQIANPGRLADGSEKKEKTYLAGTSESALLAYFSDKTFEEKELPIKVCAFSQCYRSEAGSYGKDTRGLYRLHEFMKVEQVVLCKNDTEESNQWLDKMKDISEEVLEDLKLPYRVLQICTGDMGAGKHKMYDIETWMPSRDSYGETHSDSNLTDWQARRLNIAYRNSKNEKILVHTLNNTVIASPRILIAILENYQQEDGSVLVPEVLQKYLPFTEIKAKK